MSPYQVLAGRLLDPDGLRLAQKLYDRLADGDA